MSDFKKGMWVVCKTMPHGPRGRILRIAKDGGWCDVEWTGRISKEGPMDRWTKRMRPEALAGKP